MRFPFLRGPDGNDVPAAGDADGNAKVVLYDENGPIKYLPVKVSASTDPSTSFANNDLVNTQKSITITKPSVVKNLHRLIIHNPGAVDLTIKVFNKTAIGGNNRHFIGSFIVNASATVTGTTMVTDARNILRDLFLGGSDVELIVSNNQAVGAAGAFTTTIQLYSL